MPRPVFEVKAKLHFKSEGLLSFIQKTRSLFSPTYDASSEAYQVWIFQNEIQR